MGRRCARERLQAVPAARCRSRAAGRLVDMAEQSVLVSELVARDAVAMCLWLLAEPRTELVAASQLLPAPVAPAVAMCCFLVVQVVPQRAAPLLCAVAARHSAVDLYAWAHHLAPRLVRVARLRLAVVQPRAAARELCQLQAAQRRAAPLEVCPSVLVLRALVRAATLD